MLRTNKRAADSISTSIFPGFQGTLLCCKRSVQKQGHIPGSSPGCTVTLAGRLCAPAAWQRRPAAAMRHSVPSCRGLAHLRLSCTRLQLSHPPVPGESREEGSERPPACSGYLPGAPAGRMKFCAMRAQGEAYRGKGLQTQSRLASKSPHNHVEQELCSRALMGTTRSIQPSLPHAHPRHSRPSLEQPSHRGTSGCPSSSALHQLPLGLLAFGCLWE